MQPDAVRAETPRTVGGLRQQEPSKPSSREVVQQAELGDLDAALVVLTQLEIPGGRAPDAEEP